MGPQVERGVILSGHTDVVPIKGQDWDSDPSKVVEKNGKLYGRGTCDMKGFGALALASRSKTGCGKVGGNGAGGDRGDVGGREVKSA